ncbi:xaa-pro aminopeptidase 1 [Anaeramoeba ignava]|uniref:Xaa-pro aminopeptidase 1 n=1 Tax=Anaeramoeba ignava TaxID=1746090 RepID=A0A9Q0RG44_ANAIG|nr:xaa-pro aminopeptidase 1 [Anaeramoeba ignava]
MNTKLTKIRELMQKEGIEGYIIPSEDSHMSEYTPQNYKRREFISGFSGSAGRALITMEDALLWTDSRYWIQAEKQLENGWKLMKIALYVETLEQFILNNFSVKNSQIKIGFDPEVVSLSDFQIWQQKVTQKNPNITFKSIETNLVDLVWADLRPKSEPNPAFLFPLEISGKSTEEKIIFIRNQMDLNNATVCIISKLDDIAWILNIRGSDIECNPVVISYLIVTNNSVLFFIDPKKINNEVENYLKENHVEIFPYDSFFEKVDLLKETENILLDPDHSNYKIFMKIKGNVILKSVGIDRTKSIKTESEIKAIKAAQIKDSVAMIEFLSWVDDQKKLYKESTNELKNKLCEYDFSEKLDEFRSKQNGFLGKSFPSIVGSGENGAVIHYQPDPQNSREIQANDVVLIDSGGQYIEGTTDVTRTIFFGDLPVQDIKTKFTLVLKGHISLARAIFPDQTTNGAFLDVLTRLPLWSVGLDYRHGTSHGVGCCLNVHEYPPSFSRRLINDSNTLAAGMVLSNEPGYYEEGKMGIRIENVMLVKEHSFTDYGKFLCFETISLIPFERQLIAKELLDEKEIEWINNYNKEILEKIMPKIENEKTKEWLKLATEMI